jgi:hypothetical protein
VDYKDYDIFIIYGVYCGPQKEVAQILWVKSAMDGVDKGKMRACSSILLANKRDTIGLPGEDGKMVGYASFAINAKRRLPTFYSSFASHVGFGSILTPC